MSLPRGEVFSRSTTILPARHECRNQTEECLLPDLATWWPDASYSNGDALFASCGLDKIARAVQSSPAGCSRLRVGVARSRVFAPIDQRTPARDPQPLYNPAARGEAQCTDGVSARFALP